MNIITENELFWNQLYRLSLDKETCKELQDFLPKEINTILTTLQKPAFYEYFKFYKCREYI